eukprot:CAMPEP_0206223258 /NCGR_PEP_ID=MMETSP0047_2-20121206/6392_1 /ASSEMBLY_ACC=CAM_ASM_000192 /TAXON_ID=195065 /ORGANISM="Chroomonas mesostigmatica_cf, Strain CCMP1168" /LENGTH=152 /DNA_ID=CAMNT_0053646127 /DNA_START=18 /DNA_END=473 /DNA_ORIENTATION=-
MIRAGAIFRFLSRVVLESGIETAGESTSRHAADILNSFARCGVWDEALFRRLSSIMRTACPENTPAKDIAVIVNAYSQATTRLGSTFRDTSLFLHMARLSLLKTDDELSPRVVASIVNAFARVGVWDERIFKRMSLAIRNKRPGEVSLRDVA